MREDYLNALKIENNITETENGAVAYKSTLNACLDAFSLLGTMHKSNENAILEVFDKAFTENQKLAMRLLFYVRDVRGGQGARRVFRTIVKHLAEFEPELVAKNIPNFAEFGRYDDLFCLLDTSLKDTVSDYLRSVIANDLLAAMTGNDEEISLLAKWMPSENASSKESKRYARMLIKDWGFSARAYRKMLAYLRELLDVVETHMSRSDWSRISFDKVPSKASLRYTNAFFRHDPQKYMQFLKDVAAGRTKINAATLFPVDIVRKITGNRWRSIEDTQRKLYDAMWNALPNYFGDKEETGICVVDTSGSMYDGTSLEVALSLGLYCADKCKGPFKNHFITFSANPQLQEIKGKDIVEKIRTMACADWGMNTNIEAVFDLLLSTAVRNHCPQSDIPSKIYIISDMQFDMACSSRRNSARETYMENLREEWAKYGYELPSIVYWNVRTSNSGMFQTTYNGIDCCIVGGYSASLFRDVINGTIVEVNENGEKKEKLDPIVMMYKTLMSERYDCVYGG